MLERPRCVPPWLSPESAASMRARSSASMGRPLLTDVYKRQVVKRLLASNKISFILTALVVLCATSSGDVVLSNGNYTWLLAVMTPFFFVFYDYTKLMHLGASKRDYFFGCLISYGVLALGISLINTPVSYTHLIHRQFFAAMYEGYENDKDAPHQA